MHIGLKNREHRKFIEPLLGMAVHRPGAAEILHRSGRSVSRECAEIAADTYVISKHALNTDINILYLIGAELFELIIRAEDKTLGKDVGNVYTFHFPHT